MTIERPNQADYSTWRCSVGVQMFVGNNIVQQPTMQALISVSNTMCKKKIYIHIKDLFL